MASARRSRTGLWIATAFLLFLFLFGAFAWFLNRMLVGTTPRVGAGTVLEVSLQGALEEMDTGGPFGSPLTVLEVDQAIRAAADDGRVAAVFLDIGPLAGGFAKLQEVRDAVHTFKESGKPVVALLEIGSNLEVYAAAAADTVVQIPSGQLLLGLLVQETFYTGLLDRLGVRFEAFHTGPFKTAFHAFTRRELDEAQRRMEESLLDSIYRQWVDAVAADRGIERQRVVDAFDRSLLTAADARDHGLVDVLGYRDDVDDILEEHAGRRPRHLGVREYLEATGESGRAGAFSFGPEIALVHVAGTLVPGEFEPGLFGGGLVGGDTVAGYLREARRDPSIRAIVLRVDSPGGAATAADVIGREASLAARDKPVIVSMSDVAASGGYWIAAAADRVFADPGTYTGSIGVVMGRLSLAGTYELLDIETEVLKRGENADIVADAVPLRPEQRRIFEDSIRQTYERFLGIVADGRAMEIEEVREVAEGRVWTGEQAVERGLVDELGGLRQAIVRAAADAGLGPREEALLQVYPPRRGLLEQLRGALSTRVVQLGAPASLPGMPLPVPEWLLAGGRAWALLTSPLPTAVR